MPRIDYGRTARRDLEELAAWIEARAGAATADGYVARIRDAIAVLDLFPESGHLRRSRRGLVRVLGFEKRATILYRVMPERVLILRILYAGRQD